MADDIFKVVEGQFNEADRKSAAELEALARSLRNNLDLHLELCVIMARMTRAKYEALLKEGFTDSQALALCK